MNDLTELTPKKGNPPADWRVQFLAALRKTGNVSDSARAAKVTRAGAYEARKTDEAFATAWADALEEAADVLEKAAWRRAVNGTRKPVYQGGELVGHVQEYSDTLLIFLLKGSRPEKYRERHQVNATLDGTLAIENFTNDLGLIYGDKGAGDASTDQPE